MRAALLALLLLGCAEDPVPAAPTPPPVAQLSPEPEPDDVLARAPAIAYVIGILDQQPWLACRLAIVDNLPGELDCDGDLLDWSGPCVPLGTADLGPAEREEQLYGCGAVPETCADDEAGHAALAVARGGRVFALGEDPSDEPNCGTRHEVRPAAREGERATLAIEGANHWGRWDAVYAWGDDRLEQRDVRRSLR